MADHATRPDPGLRAAPRLRPATLRPVARRRPPRRPRSWTGCSARCWTPPRRPGRHGGGALRVRHHRRRPGRSTSTGCCAPRACCGCYTQDGHGVPGPVDVAGVRGRRPPDRPRLRARPGRRAGGGEALRRRCPGWPRCSTTRARPRTAWTIRAPASWCWSPSRTPGSPTTTGSTTRAAPDFARLVEIHRKPGYDPAELFFDPAGAGRGQAPGRRGAGPQEARHALPDERGRPRRRRRGRYAARTAGCRPTRRTARCCSAPTRRRPGTGSPPPRSRTCCWSWPG